MSQETASSPSDRVEAVERALVLLRCFKAPGEALSLAVLAQRSALYKSTILRLAGSLVRHGFLHRDTDGRYLLGPELRRLGGLSHAEPDLVALIRPVLAYLVTRSQETASFYVRHGDARLCLVRQNSPRLARHHLEEGALHPLGSGAAGSVLRAFAGERGKEADAIRRQGWAVSLGNRDPDLAAVAVPVFNGSGLLLGALTVSGLLTRFSPDLIAEYRNMLIEQSTELKPRLGDLMPPA
ncbi:MAG TPA: IclR family transcriptional regulator [Aliidongia sp.]|nr:IclR family transcriptional regulator [Aliidongia sp.]